MLSPKRIEVDCVFACPECSCETWYTIRELKHRTSLDCLCGTKTKIQPVQGVEVVYAGKKVSQFDQSGQNPDTTGQVERAETAKTATFATNPDQSGHADFVATLVGLGHKRSEAKRIVDLHSGEFDGDDHKFITLLLQKGMKA